MSTKPTFNEYLSFRQVVSDFFEGNMSPWAYRLLFEAIENNSFVKDITPLLKKVKDNLSHKEIDELIGETRSRCNLYLNKAKAEKDLEKKFALSCTMMAYFGLTECLHEHGTFTEKVFDELKKEFGSDYLKRLQEVDQNYLSDDTRKLYKVSENKEWPQNEAICKYLVLKKWQDDQHVYYLKNIENFIWPLEDLYIASKGQQAFFPQNLKHINNINAQKVRFLDNLSKKDIISLDDLAKGYIAGVDRELLKLVGGKAYGLAVLRAKGANVPETYVVPVNHSTVSPNALLSLAEQKYAVRSSADIEDGGEHSFAGMFDSVLDVNKEGIKKAFKKVKDSVSNKRVLEYRRINGLPDPSMAVIIQRFKEPEFSGVWIGSSADAGVLEWVKGNGEKLVSGKITPNHESFDLETDVPKGLSINGKTIGEQLIEMQKRVSETGTADFEWCILDGKLNMLQFRPVTTNLVEPQISRKNIVTPDEDTYRGLPVSPGKVSGKAKFVRKINELDKWDDGDILMAWFTDPEWMHVLTKSSGIVTAVGGFLCHTAIIARELGIPCIVGIGGNSMKKIWDKTYLSVDGTMGIVSTKKQKKTLDIRKVKHDEHSK